MFTELSDHSGPSILLVLEMELFHLGLPMLFNFHAER
jgi:hypothetical protein